MHAPLGSRAALLGDFGVGLGAALGGRPRRARIDMRGRGRWPSAGATLDLDFVNQQGYAYGQGIGRIRDLVTISGGAGGTVVGPSGLIVPASAPRFDYDPVSLACKGLLIEEQRTNNFLYTQNFAAGAWGKVALSPSAPVAGFDGALTATKLIEDNTSAQHYLNQNQVLTAGANTLSVIAKAAERSWIRLQVAGNANVWFNLAAGVMGTQEAGVTGTITPIKDGWYLCTATGAKVTNVSYFFIQTANGQTTYPGDGASGIYIDRPQVEAGSFATSGIPTVGAAVTRTADSLTISGANFASWFNPREGTLCAEADHGSSSNFPVVVVLSSAHVSNDQIVLYTTSVTAPGETLFVRAGGVIQANINGGSIVPNGQAFRSAGAFAANDFEVSLNGGAPVTDLSGSIPPVDRLFIGASLLQNNYWLNGHVKRLRYWPRRLSNGELQELTR